ncbi:hypothetical protein CC78DRAFT_310963 [Lojkania enalia]|uniref:Uncharacterized protein n=1 Tax=Lojkania enalia TaxID=147567 RepID=A0A9P4MYN5_9PLEO|nr:hypothetical protein CC78DRAFT_310963 [Didymosphaeria enalia]
MRYQQSVLMTINIKDPIAHTKIVRFASLTYSSSTNTLSYHHLLNASSHKFSAAGKGICFWIVKRLSDRHSLLYSSTSISIFGDEDFRFKTTCTERERRVLVYWWCRVSLPLTLYRRFLSCVLGLGHEQS